VQDQVHAERPIGQRPDPADFPTKERRRAQLGLQDAQTASVADRRDEVRTGLTGPIGAAMMGYSIPSM
jgi:hypothetical protein